MNKQDLNRRKFITQATVGTLGVVAVVSACTNEKSTTKALVTPPNLLNKAPDGKIIKAGLVGCGGRGTGAALNFLDAGSDLEIVALGDVFQDKIDNCRAKLKEEKGI